MKKSFFILLFASLSATIFMSNEGGAAVNFPGDRTGRVTVTNTCRGCHSGSAYGNVTVAQIVKDAGGNTVTSYIGGMTYTITLTINTTQGTPAAYGFQWASVQQADNATQAGTPTTAQARTAVHALSGRNYVEQAGALSTNIVTFTWVAPAAGTGAVKTVFVGMAINGDGNSGGTDTVSPSTSVTLSETVATDRLDAPTSSIKIQPNPVSDVLHLQCNTPKSGNYIVEISDVNGRIVAAENALLDGNTNLHIDINTLLSGIYIVRLLNANSAVASATMIKK
jgi:hypothetical protein